MHPPQKSVEGAVKAVLREAGRIDVLVNNVSWCYRGKLQWGLVGMGHHWQGRIDVLVNNVRAGTAGGRGWQLSWGLRGGAHHSQYNYAGRGWALAGAGGSGAGGGGVGALWEGRCWRRAAGRAPQGKPRAGAGLHSLLLPVAATVGRSSRFPLHWLCPAAPQAGVSRVGPLAEQPLGEVEEVLQTNLVGLLRVTQVRPPPPAWAPLRRRRLVVAALWGMPGWRHMVFLTAAAAEAFRHSSNTRFALCRPPTRAQAVAPGMMRQRSGLIVQIGSVTAMLATPFAGAPPAWVGSPLLALLLLALLLLLLLLPLCLLRLP